MQHHIPQNAIELFDDIIIKAKTASGSYEDDPNIAKLYMEFSVHDVIEVMKLFPFRWCRVSPIDYSVTFIDSDDGAFFGFYKRNTYLYEDSHVKRWIRNEDNIEFRRCELVYRVPRDLAGTLDIWTAQWGLNRKPDEISCGMLVDGLQDYLCKLLIHFDAQSQDQGEFSIKSISANSPESGNVVCSWSEVVIEVISDECIHVKLGAEKRKYHYAELGFKDGRKGDKPDSRWKLLLKLASIQEISYQVQVDQSTRNQAKAAISVIRRRLKKYFGIQDDPFYDYREIKAYRPKFRLIDSRHQNARD